MFRKCLLLRQAFPSPLRKKSRLLEMYCTADSVHGLSVELHRSETIKQLYMLGLLMFEKCFEILTHKISLLIYTR